LVRGTGEAELACLKKGAQCEKNLRIMSYDAEGQSVNSQGEVTTLLAAWGGGDQNALRELMPLVYNELHRIARRSWNWQNEGNTLQPTALINEAFIKLAGAENASYQNRCHFIAVACTAMRQILVNHALSRRSAKRGSGAVTVSLDDVQLAVHQEAAEVVALHEAL